MAEPKTRPTKASVEKFLNAIKDEESRRDCFTVLEMMKQATGAAPRMWGTSIVGFGEIPLKYASGRELMWPIAGFSPRKQNLTLYIMTGFTRYDALMAKLGKHTTGKSCLYIKRLADVDRAVLRQLIVASVAAMKRRVQ